MCSWFLTAWRSSHQRNSKKSAGSGKVDFTFLKFSLYILLHWIILYIYMCVCVCVCVHIYIYNFFIIFYLFIYFFILFSWGVRGGGSGWALVLTSYSKGLFWHFGGACFLHLQGDCTWFGWCWSRWEKWMYAVYLIYSILPEPVSVMLKMEAVHSSETSQQTLTIEYEHLIVWTTVCTKIWKPIF